MNGKVAVALSAYTLIIILALAWAVLAGRPDLTRHPSPLLELEPQVALAASLLAGAGLALFTVVITRRLVEETRWASRLHIDIRNLLGPMPRLGIALLALASGLAEELFFRGAMQPSFGLLATALVFGALHIGPFRGGWTWAAWAFAMGLAFGAIHAATGSIAGPVLAHVWINYQNICFMVTHEARCLQEHAAESDQETHSPGTSCLVDIGTESVHNPATVSSIAHRAPTRKDP